MPEDYRTQELIRSGRERCLPRTLEQLRSNQAKCCMECTVMRENTTAIATLYPPLNGRLHVYYAI